MRARRPEEQLAGVDSLNFVTKLDKKHRGNDRNPLQGGKRLSMLEQLEDSERPFSPDSNH